MYRNALIYMKKWISAEERKPLVIRGARQVGKTTLVTLLGEQCGRQVINLNFEANPEYISLFNTNDPKQILTLLSSHFNQAFTPENSILLLDEIQAAPLLLAKLRWIYEKMPALPVVATGSLLDFVLAKHEFSMPVGRITYLYLEPLSFEEFLLAGNQKQLHDFITQFELNDAMPQLIHNQLMQLFKTYTLIGGMPAAVKTWIKTQDLTAVATIHSDLLATYRDDFSKYAGRMDTSRLNEILLAIPNQLACKFVFTHVNPEVATPALKQALQSITQARLATRIHCTHANGLPLGATINPKMFKMVLLDVGLASNALGLRLDTLMTTQQLDLINKGAIAEQVVGQLLKTTTPFYKDPELYYWTRASKMASAEIDYITHFGEQIVPIEVKSGKTGTLKSLHLFMAQKKLHTAIRINADVPSLTPVSVTNPLNELSEYQLLSLPFYLIEQWMRLYENAIA